MLVLHGITEQILCTHYRYSNLKETFSSTIFLSSGRLHYTYGTNIPDLVNWTEKNQDNILKSEYDWYDIQWLIYNNMGIIKIREHTGVFMMITIKPILDNNLTKLSYLKGRGHHGVWATWALHCIAATNAVKF